MKPVLRFLLFGFLFLSSCQPVSPAVIELANFQENFVDVKVTLLRAEDGQPSLAATFTPLEPNLRLYSKDIPRSGVDGVGRPALIEIPPDSDLRAAGSLRESVAPQSVFMDTPELPVYPPGSVTFFLPVILPPGSGWVTREILVTYMACSDYACRAPVEGKVVPVYIPQRDAWN